MAGLLDNLPGAGSLDQRAGLLDRLSAGERVSPEERAAVDASSQTSLNEFQKGLRRFGYSTLATSQAFAGQMLQPVAPQLGQGLINEGQATVRAMPRTIQPEFESFDQAQAAGLRGLGSYAASALGEGLPSTALMLGAGLAGRGAATLARATPAARAAAQYGAGMGTMVPLEGGETALQLNQDPQALANTTPAERAALTLGRGVTNAALENIVPQALLMPRLLGQAGRIAPGVGPAVGNVLRTGAAGAIGEYGTEAAQDLTGQAALNFARRDPLTNFDLSQANEAGIRGAITGGVTGGLGGAVQGVYSNIGAGADAVTDAVKSRLPNLPGLPSMDSVVGRFTQMVNRPQEFGADMANMTLDGIDAAARNAGPAFTAGRQAVGRGLEQAESGVGWLKKQVDSYIVRNIAPEKRAEFAEVSARLGTLNPAAWQTFKAALQREGNEEFRADAAASARMFGRGAVEGAKGTWNWLKDVGTGVSDAVRARRDAKQSFVVRQFSEDDRKDLKTLLKNGDPQTYNVFRKASISEQRQLADILLSARDDTRYFSATDAKGRLLRQNIIDGWQRSTGTDIRETLDKLNEWRNAETLRKAEAKAGRTGDVDAELVKMERQIPGARSKLRVEYDETGKSKEVGLTEEKDGPTFDESGNVMDEDKPYTTPFDLKTFQDSLAATNFDKDNPARGGVEVKLVADGIKPSELAQLVGKKESVKTGGKWQGQTSPYSEQELAQFDKDGAVTTRVNLMSLWGAAQNEANRAKFAEFIDAYDSERTTDERAGDAGFTLLAQLGSDGFKIPLADGREVSVQVQLPENAEQSISGDMVIRRAGQGKKPYTYADYRGDSRRALSREKQLALLTEDQTPENLRALADGGNKTAERIGKILYARAAGASEIGRPTGQQLAVELKKYRAELTEKIQSTETYKRVQRDVEILREALINGVLSQSDIEALARYYTKVDERGDSITDGIADPQEREAERGRVFAIAKRVMSSVGARKGNKLMSREGPGAAMLGRQLRAMAADVDLRQEDFFDSITGRNAGNPSDSADQEFLANMQEPQQRANTARAAALMRDIDRGIKPAAPAPASTQNVRVQRLPYVGPDAPPLLQRVTKAIAEAKTLEALQKIGNTLGLFTSRMPKAEVKSLRNQYAAKQRDLRERSALGRTATQPGVNAADAARQRDLKGRSALGRIATQLDINAADIASIAVDEASGRAGLDFGPDINVVITTRDGKSVTALVNNEDQTNAQRYLIRAQRSADGSSPTLPVSAMAATKGAARQPAMTAAQKKERAADLLKEWTDSIAKSNNTLTAPLREIVEKKLLPKKKRDEMAAALEQLDQIKSGMYDKGGVAQRTVDNWSREYANGASIKVISLPADSVYGKEVASAFGDVSRVGGMALTIDGQHYIGVFEGGFNNKSTSMSRLAHEFGHILQRVAFDNAPKAVQDKLVAAFEDDKNAFLSSAPEAAKEVSRFLSAARFFDDENASAINQTLLSLPAIMRAGAGREMLDKIYEQQGALMKKKTSVKQLNYFLSFDEWFAEQFSKYATSVGTKMDDDVRSFWADLYKTLKEFFDAVVSKMTPNQEFQTWVESLVPAVNNDAALETEISTAIAEAKTPLRLQQISARINKDKDQLGEQALARLREAWAKKRGELRASAPPPPPPPPDAEISGLERNLAARIEAAQTKLGLMQIANTIKKAGKNALPDDARQRLRDLWKAKETALENPSAEPPKPPAPPPPTPPAPPPPTPPSSEAQKKFVEAVEKLVGKRVRVVFDAALQNGVAAEYQSREAALEQIRDERRAAQADLKIPASARDSNLTDEELRQNIAKADAKEQEILNDKAILGVITVAVGMEEKAGLAEHEAFHGAFAFFFNKDPEMRRVLGLAFSEGLVGRRLREYFKGNDDVLALIDPQSKSYDPEEAAAYGFQVWMHDPSVLKLGEKAESMFARVKQFFRDLFGLLTPEQKALLVLNDLKSGRLADKGTSPLAKQLDKDRPWTERAQKYARDIGGIGMKFYDMALSSVYQRVVDFENPVLTKIAKSVYSATGEMSSAGMIQRQMAEERTRRNQLAQIFADLTDDQKLQLHDAKVFDKPPSDPMLRERWDQLNAYYKDMYDYQVAAGVELNNAGIKNNYYPLTWDPEKVLKNKDAFLKMLSKYEDDFVTVRKTPDEVYTGIVGYLERGEDLVNVMGSDNEPTAEHTRTRTLAFIDREDRRPFMTDDPIATAVRYTKQAVRQAEYVRAFGMQGRLLQDMKTEARKVYGATEEEIALVDDLINGALGNKEAGMSRELKDLYGGLTVYQNIRLLPFSIFSSLVDPMGIAVRSNSIGDAWDTFTYSIKNLFKEWKKDYTPDQWETIATDWGIIERAGTTINTDALYTGVTLRGTTKKINDAFFKYNLLNGWIRNNHIMATKAAQQFMYRASEGFFKGKGQNERYLEELGVSKDDIVYNEQLGRILLKTDELMAAGKTQEEASAIEGRLRAATQKFVRQALLNPTAPELANWASNPYLAPITHLKQFVWAFNATITNRVANELENNNYKPLMLAAAYVPAMIAADFLKDMVNYAGEEPPYKKDWGVVDYVKHGINRSGFTGTGAFFVDAKEDIMRGGTGGESFAGPSLEQLKKLVQALGADDSAPLERWMVKALPANALYDQALMD